MFDLFGTGTAQPTATATRPSGGFDLFGDSSAPKSSPLIADQPTQDWNGQKIPANIPTKNLVAFNQATGNKTFSLPLPAGQGKGTSSSGVYTVDSNNNIVKGGHTNYGGVASQPGMQRDDMIPAGLGGANSQAGNIKMVPLSVAHQQDQVETGLSRQVKEGLIDPKAAITSALDQKQQIANKPSLWDSIKGVGGNVVSGVVTGAQMLEPHNIAANMGIKPAKQVGFTVGEGLPEGTGPGTKMGAKAAIINEQIQAQQDQAVRASNNASAMSSQNLVDSVQHIPRVVAALTISGYQMFQDAAENQQNLQNSLTGQKQIPHTTISNTVEPLEMSKTSQLLLGTDTIKDLPSQAADLEEQLNKAGIKGNTAAILASLGVSADTVATLYPFMAKGIGAAANDAVDSLANSFTKDTGVKISRSEMYQISRGDPENLVPTETKTAWASYVNKAAAAKLAAQGPVELPQTSETPVSSALRSASSKDIFGGQNYVPKATINEQGFPTQNPIVETPTPAEPKALTAPQSSLSTINEQGFPTGNPIIQTNPPVVPSETTPVATSPTQPVKSEVAIPKPIEPTVSEPAQQGQTPSKIATSIEQKAVEKKLTQGFEGVAGYDKITIKDQAERATKLMADPEQAMRVIRGEDPLPEGLRGTALLTAAENYAVSKGDGRMLYELANSPLTSETSAAAQEMRLAAEREPDSVTAKLQDIKKAKEAAAVKKNGNLTKARAKATTEIKSEMVKATPKIKDWTDFIESIKCA